VSGCATTIAGSYWISMPKPLYGGTAPERVIANVKSPDAVPGPMMANVAGTTGTGVSGLSGTIVGKGGAVTAAGGVPFGGPPNGVLGAKSPEIVGASTGVLFGVEVVAPSGG
jgi:hypothetical protein